MNFFDKFILALDPERAFRRQQFRGAHAAYEAGNPGRLRKDKPDNASGNTVVGRAGSALRGYARQLEQNHDISTGVLRTLVNNTVGPNGISVDPQPKNKKGEIHQEFADLINKFRKDWNLKPEVTWEHDWAAAERLACWTWFRDGEVLTQLLEGKIASLNHGTKVPFSLELIESDHLPFDDFEKNNITQGVERNVWGRPIAYHIHKTHPGDSTVKFDISTKRVSADKVLHAKIVSRIRQVRGVSIFASVLRRLEDIKDIEESERVAARIAAVLVGYIKKGASEAYSAPDGDDEERRFKMTPGMMFDKLKPGEEVGTIQSNRPSPLVAPFVNLQHRAVSAGTGANYSSISKNYDGSYSAQRQELVEGWGNYQVCTNLFASQFSRPIHQRFVQMLLLSGLVKIPSDLDMDTVFDADYRGPAMPWIDPDKESKANERLERAGHKAPQKTIRERGDNPADVRKQIKQWRDQNDEDGLIFTTDPKHDKPVTNESPDDSGLSGSDEEENNSSDDKYKSEKEEKDDA